jgi:hypothetical protein
MLPCSALLRSSSLPAYEYIRKIIKKLSKKERLLKNYG